MMLIKVTTTWKKHNKKYSPSQCPSTDAPPVPFRLLYCSCFVVTEQTLYILSLWPEGLTVTTPRVINLFRSMEEQNNIPSVSTKCCHDDPWSLPKCPNYMLQLLEAVLPYTVMFNSIGGGQRRVFHVAMPNMPASKFRMRFVRDQRKGSKSKS